MHSSKTALFAGLILFVVPAAVSAQAIDSEVYQLQREDLVRWDNPRIKVELHPEWIVDAPPRIDKRDFRDPRGGDWAPSEIYVRFRPGTSAEEKALAHLFVSDAEVTWESEMVPDLYAVKLRGLAVPEAVNAYLDLAQVLYAEPIRLVRPTNDPNDTLYTDLWGMKTGASGIFSYGTYAQFAWDEWQGDQEFVIAVIDTGVETPHTDLLDNQWNNWAEITGITGVDDDGNGKVDDYHGWNVKENNNTITSCGNDHGTHVAGTIGARGNNGYGVVGVNWRCRIMTLRCNGPDTCDPDGDDGPLPTGAYPCCGLYNVVQGLDYAVQNGARVSNHSYGGTSWDGQAQQSFIDEILAAQAPGHIAVIAAGNDGKNNDTAPQYPASINLDNIISVAAVDDAGGKASFSNYGAQSVDLAAPGTWIKSTVVGGFENKEGTSMASPHVAGAVALVWSKHPELNWTQVRDRILTGANPSAAFAGKTTTGGTLSAWRSLGIWAGQGVVGGGLQYGAAWNPVDYTQPSGLTLAGQLVPTWGTLNLMAGDLPKSAWDAASASTGLGTKPLIIEAQSGPVRIGTP